MNKHIKCMGTSFHRLLHCYGLIIQQLLNWIIFLH